MLLALPDRLAPRLSGLDEFAAHQVLSEEINRVCNEIAGSAPLE
jgi:hypothetical protein